MDGRVSFRSLNHWTQGHSTVDDILKFELVKDTFDESVRSYLENPDTVAITAITSMVTAGFVHLDICWRHVALLPVKPEGKKNWNLKPILIDLHRYRTVEKGEDQQIIIDKCVSLLQHELNASKL
jgi:hypothetical protein